MLYRLFTLVVTLIIIAGLVLVLNHYILQPYLSE